MELPKFQFVDQVSSEEFNKLIDSIDTVLFDIDGVLTEGSKFVIKGADLAVEKFRKLGKKIGFITENTINNFKTLESYLAPFKCNLNEVVTPVSALIDQLKTFNFQKDIYIIASDNVKELLTDAGYRVITYEDIHSTKIGPVSKIVEFDLKTKEICKNVGLVYVDLAIDFTFLAIQAALVILNDREKDVLFYSGNYVDLGLLAVDHPLISTRFLVDSLERWTNKKAVIMGKSGAGLKLAEIVKRKFGITDPSKVLMVGDIIESDVLFGVKAGFKTLLVLSGTTKKEDLLKLTDFFPNYVAESLGEFGEKIKEI